MSRRRNKRNKQSYREFIQPDSGIYSAFTESSQVDKHRIIERNYLRNITEWAITRFKWSGLPDTVDVRFLEKELFLQGYIVFYYDDRYGKYMIAKGTPLGPNNLYDNPIGVRTVSTPGYSSIVLQPKECVIIWSSYTRTVELPTVQLYAARLAELDVSLQVVSKSMRVNTLLKTSRSQLLTMTNLMKQRDEGIEYIVVDDSFDESKVEAFNLGVDPRILPALRNEKNQLWNETMTMLGIDNANQDKKERLVVSEVSANDGQIKVARNAAMRARVEAVEEINRKFDLSARVDWSTEIQDTLDAKNMAGAIGSVQ